MRYCVYIDWYYEDSRCIISHSTPEKENLDGDNLVGHGGNSGYSFDIYDTLEEAIIQSQYNPQMIDFSDLSNDELLEKEDILSKYIWNSETGYQKTNKK